MALLRRGLAAFGRRDAELALNRLQPGSVIAVTVNAEWSTYRKRQSAVESARKAGRELDPRAVATLTTLLGDVVPQRFLQVERNDKPADVVETEFPQCLAESLLAFFAHKVVVQARRAEGMALSFVPLFSFSHKDGDWMVTVGGALCTAEQKPIWTSVLEKDLIVGGSAGVPVHQVLDMIPITLREMLLMDGLLPIRSPPCQCEVRHLPGAV